MVESKPITEFDEENGDESGMYIKIKNIFIIFKYSLLFKINLMQISKTWKRN